MTTCSLRTRRNLASQGFSSIADDERTAALARATRFQPRATLLLLVTGVALVASGVVGTTFGAAWFGVLAALGWAAVLVPPTNVFDLAWNRLARDSRSTEGVPAPRRFSQAIASAFLTTIAVLFFLPATTAAFVVAGIMAVAASLAAFGDVCIGSELYNLLSGRRPASA